MLGANVQKASVSSPRPTTGALPLDHTGSSDPPDPLAALSGNESLCFSLRLIVF